MGYPCSFEFGIIRNHYVGRTFITPSQRARELKVKTCFGDSLFTVCWLYCLLLVHLFGIVHFRCLVLVLGGQVRCKFNTVRRVFEDKVLTCCRCSRSFLD